MSIDKEELISKVTAATSGTRGDPLSREEVAAVVEATLAELAPPQGLEGGGEIAPPE